MYDVDRLGRRFDFVHVESHVLDVYDVDRLGRRLHFVLFLRVLFPLGDPLFAVVAAWAELGGIATLGGQRGGYLSVQVGF